MRIRSLVFLLSELLFFTDCSTCAYAISTKNVYYAENYDILPDGRPIADKLSSLTRMVSNSGGGAILFEKGQYVMGAGLTEDGKPTGNVRLYPNVAFIGVEGTVIKANVKKESFHSMFCTIDHTVENVIFENITFDTYIGTNNKKTNDFRLAIILHWCKNTTIHNCKFVYDIGTIDTRYSHDINDKNSGAYRVNGLVIENCNFVARILEEKGYKDITSVGICAQNVFFRNNSFSVLGGGGIKGDRYYPNCCLEIQGKDVWVYNNNFEDLTNAIDISSTDSYSDLRNIFIFDNKIRCYRGVALWSKGRNISRGITIQNNYFCLACDNLEKRVTGIKGCIVLVTHSRDSYNGTYKDIVIAGNIFDYKETEKFYKSLSYDDWIRSAQHKYDEKSGITYEEYYSAIALGGTSCERCNIYVNNNTFLNSVFPCVYIGGEGYSQNHYICDNVFENCGVLGSWPMISLVNKCISVYVTGNDISITSDNITIKEGVFCQTKIVKQLYKNNTGKDTSTFNRITIKDNKTKSSFKSCIIHNDVPFLDSGDNNTSEAILLE